MGLINLMGPSVQADMGMPTDLYPRQKAPIVTGKPVYQAPEKKGFFEKLGSGAMEYLGDPTNRARLAAAFNTMRLNPDPNIARMAQSQIETQQALDLLKGQGTRTAEWLKSVGREDLAQLVLQQPAMAKTAVAEALKAPEKPTSFEQKVSALVATGTPIKEAVEKVIGSSGTSITIGGQELTPGFEALDREYATEHLEWTRGGGSDMSRQIAQIGTVLGMLEQGQPLTGEAINYAPDFFKAIFNPKALNAKEQVEEVVQRNLRVVLGAQFTEKEGERLISRAYNEKLLPEMNAKRLRTLYEHGRTATKCYGAVF